MSVGGKMKKLEKLRFVLTDEMNKMFIEVLIIKQRLEADITLKEQIILENGITKDAWYLRNSLQNKVKNANTENTAA